jgi:putative endonuclease
LSFWVYILKSQVRDRYYIGSSEDVERRVREHNGSRARWTGRYQPWELLHKEEFDTRGEAVKREHFLKRCKGIGRKLEELKRGEL